MNKSINTKDICVTAMGISLFVVLSMCLRIPIFENYYICLGYVVMTVYLYNVGTVSGTLVGCIGTFIYCVLINGLRGMPGWVLGNLVIGIMMGLTMRRINIAEKKILSYIIIVLISCISVLLGILVVKSLVECILYTQPILIRIFTNTYAFIADCVTIVLSIPLAISLKKIYK